MHNLAEVFEEEAPRARPPINDAASLLAIRRAARIARERLELAPDVAAVADALASIERLAGEALVNGGGQ